MYNPYNNYNNYTNPYMNNYAKNYPTYQQALQQQLMQAQQTMPQQQPIMSQPQELPIQGIKFLTADEIRAYIVMPNTKEMLIDMAGGLAYIKSADAMGQSSVKTYKFEETTEQSANAASSGKLEPKIDLTNYVQKEDLESLSKSLTDKLSKLEKKINIKEIMEAD